jgi:hypothetical protein
MRGPSAGIRRRCPCNLAKSPCIAPNCRERQVGFGLPGQPPSRGFSGSLPTLTKACGRSPELRHKLTVCLSDFTPESASQREDGAYFPFYLYRPLLGVTLARGADGPRDQPCIMMCIEVRIRCTQPPSHGFSGSLPTSFNQYAGSAEIRHRMGVFLRNLSPERRFGCASAQLLAFYLYRAFCGVTLEDLADARVMLSSNPMFSAA